MRADKCATIRKCKISRLLFADDLVLLSSRESDRQHVFNSFSDVCETAGVKTRNPYQCPRAASEWSDIEADIEVQVSWGCIRA